MKETACFIYSDPYFDIFGEGIPISEDDSWLDAFQRMVPQVAQSFQPDVILSQHGCDAHRWDLMSTMIIYREVPRLIHEWAHQLCEGRWVALGGVGYDIWRVVPRV